MAGFRIEGDTSGNVAEVDVNKNALVNLPYTTPAGVLQGGGPTKAGYVTVQYELDSGSETGVRHLKNPLVSEHRRLTVGLDTMAAMYNFNATAQNTGDFKHASSVMTMTQSGGFLNINPALATGSGNYAYLQTWKHFSLQADAEFHDGWTLIVTGTPPANQILEFGHFLGTAGVAPADGVFFRITSAGIQGIMTYNGVETATGVCACGPLAANMHHHMVIIVSHLGIHFWKTDDVTEELILLADLKLPAGNTVPYLSMALPKCVQMRNSGVVTGGFTAKIGQTHVTQLDLNAGRTWAEQQAAQGNAYQGQEGDTMGSVAVYSNGALAAAAALTNTTAAAGNTGLGGVVLVLPTLASGTDGILLSYLNPVGSITQSPKTLVVTGVTISGGVTVVLSAAAILNLVFGVAFGHTALSLATTESASFAAGGTTKAPRRVPLGNLNSTIAAAAGTSLTGGPINVKFTSPIVVNPGEYFAITMSNVGVVTAPGAIAVVVGVDHYFE